MENLIVALFSPLQSQHIEEMGPTPGQLTGPAPPDSPPWEEAALPAMAETPETFSNITDPQELLAMIGQQPMSEAMLQVSCSSEIPKNMDDSLLRSKPSG